MAFDLKTWKGFKDLPTGGVDYLLDTAAINRKLAARSGNPFRWKEATFQMPKTASEARTRTIARNSIEKWLRILSGEGWELAGQIGIKSKRTAQDLASGVALLDTDEWTVRAAFRLRRTPQRIRIELPPGVVRKAPDQTMTLKEAIIAHNLKREVRS